MIKLQASVIKAMEDKARFFCEMYGKESPCNVRDLGSIPGLGRSPGGRHGNPLQCSCLENPMDRGAWQAMVSKSRTQLKRLSMQTHIILKHTSSGD